MYWDVGRTYFRATAMPPRSSVAKRMDSETGYRLNRVLLLLFYKRFDEGLSPPRLVWLAMPAAAWFLSVGDSGEDCRGGWLRQRAPDRCGCRSLGSPD